ncbi:MAG: TAXI family TRAP transporter solute-binding subunit [Hyphomicrobiales bacterium]|nr:TAXI family TRAP transporter solute-binding subunit [Hyphomicrobiales bacterium]
MNTRLFSTIAITAATVAAAGAAQAQNLRAETGASVGLSHIIPQYMAKHLAKDGIKLQINADSTLTKSALKLGAGQLDMAVVPPPAHAMMRAGKGPYRKAGKKAIALAANNRALFGFIAGYFHIVVWDNSPIKTWKDFKGKKVFIGPPGGAANRQISSVIELASGYKLNGKDYQPVRLGWGAGIQAFQDGQMDVLIQPAPAGSAAIDQIGLQRKMRILSLPKGSRSGPNWEAKVLGVGLLAGDIPAKTYSGQTNNQTPIETVAYTMQVSVNKKMSDETAYKLTRSFLDNVDEAKKTIAVLRLLPADNPLIGVNMPLHPGAVRYMKEKKIKVPAKLMAK